MMSPFSWKYLTNGAAFCLKFISLLWVAFRLSSGRPCCSARFSNLSLSLWLAQARNTTRSGVQICGEHQTSRQVFKIATNASADNSTHLSCTHGFCCSCHNFWPSMFFASTFPGLSLYTIIVGAIAITVQVNGIPKSTQPYTETLPYFRKIFFVYAQIYGWIKNNIGQSLSNVTWF